MEQTEVLGIDIVTPLDHEAGVDCHCTVVPGHPGDRWTPPEAPEIRVYRIEWVEGPPAEPDPPGGWRRWLEDHRYGELVAAYEELEESYRWEDADARYEDARDDGRL